MLSINTLLFIFLNLVMQLWLERVAGTIRPLALPIGLKDERFINSISIEFDLANIKNNLNLYENIRSMYTCEIQ